MRQPHGWRRPGRQRQDHHLQGGPGSGRGCGCLRIRRLAATSSPTETATRASISARRCARLADRGDVLKAVDLASGVAKAVNTAGAAVITGSTSAINAGTGVLTLNSSTGADLSVTGKADLLKELGLTTSVGSGNVTVGKPRTTGCDNHRQPDPGRLDPEREWPHHHLLQRARAGGGAGPDRFGHPQRRPDRRQRQLDRLSADGDHCRHAERDRSGFRRADRIEHGRRRGILPLRPGVTPSSVNANGTLKLSTGTAADLSISGGIGNALSALGLNGPTGNSSSFNAARTAGVGGINGKTLTFTLLQRRHGGQCHLRRRHRRYGQDARSAERRVAGQQPAGDGRCDRQAADHGEQRFRFLDPRVGGGGRRDRRHHHRRVGLVDPLDAGRGSLRLRPSAPTC